MTEEKAKKIHFSEYYEKLKLDLFTTIRLRISYYQCFNTYEIHVKRKKFAICQIISVQPIKLGTLLKIPRLIEIDTDGMKPREFYELMSQFYNPKHYPGRIRTRFTNHWRGMDTWLVILFLLKIDNLKKNTRQEKILTYNHNKNNKR